MTTGTNRDPVHFPMTGDGRCSPIDGLPENPAMTRTWLAATAALTLMAGTAVAETVTTTTTQSTVPMVVPVPAPVTESTTQRTYNGDGTVTDHSRTTTTVPPSRRMVTPRRPVRRPKRQRFADREMRSARPVVLPPEFTAPSYDRGRRAPGGLASRPDGSAEPSLANNNDWRGGFDGEAFRPGPRRPHECLMPARQTAEFSRTVVAPRPFYDGNH